MSTLKRKFELIKRLESLGFSFDEAQQLRRIEMTLHRWAEAECNGEIQRDETDGQTYRHYGRNTSGPFLTVKCADREAGALKRLKAIIDARNARAEGVRNQTTICGHACLPENEVIAYQQGDPRGCALYLLKRADIREGETIDCVYSRGLAVCA